MMRKFSQLLVKIAMLIITSLISINSFASAFKILVLIPEKQNDHSFSQAAYDGLQKTIQKNTQYDVKYLLNVDALSEQEQLKLIDQYYQQGYKAVVGTGEEYANVMSIAANKYKDGRFSMIGCTAKPGVHNFCLDNSPYGGELAGIVAGVLTKSNIIGSVGGERRVENNLIASYQYSAEKINPNIEILTDWTRDWNNLIAAKTLTQIQIQAGADVIFSVSNIGPTIAAKNAKNVRIIGWMTDQSTIAPDNVATSVLADFSKVYQIVFTNISAPSYKPGITPITDNSVWSLAPFGKNVTTKEQAKIKANLAKILKIN